jgi:hypothetical protein
MPTKTCNRIDLALEQLETAICLFIDGNAYSAAITLAATAERVLGQAVRRAGEQAVLDWSFQASDVVHTALHGEQLSHKTFVDAENRVSNALRHFDALDEPEFEADLEEVACWMLVRACENAHRLGLNIEGFHIFNEWFIEHVVGV